MRIEHTIGIDAPVSEVWALTIDIETLPSLTSTITSAERLDDRPLTVGSKVRLKQPGQRERVWTVTALEPERLFAWSTRAMGTTMTATHELTGSGDGTNNTLRIDIEGALAPLVGALVKKPIAKALATENMGFKRAAER